MADAETKWLAKMQKLLNQCPPTLGFFTIGDRCLHVYDLSKEPLIDAMTYGERTDFCTAVDDLNASKGMLGFPCAVHSTAG